MLKTKKEQYNMWELFKDKNTINEKTSIQNLR